MSVSLWRWTEDCDNQYCPGDCDLCEKTKREEAKRIETVNEILLGWLGVNMNDDT